MIERVIDQKRKSLGGFEVGRVLPNMHRRMVGPFIFFDHMGPMALAKNEAHKFDVRPHPHIGLSTVTYLFEGEITHRDSVGSELPIRAGEVNWMTAGSGITHSERFDHAHEVGGSIHGIQAWVALPKSDEEIAPSFAHFDLAALREIADGGVWSRIIAGEAYGERSDVRISSPLFYVHQELAAGTRSQLPKAPERAAYVVRGSIEVDGKTYNQGQMVIFAANTPAELTAVTSSTLMLLGGEPVGERFIEWNFVSSSKERIAQAKADWRAGRMKLPDVDHNEFIPLPDDPPALHTKGTTP